MPSTYSPSLRLELIADNEQAGIWGQTTNRNFVQVFEESIVGVTEVNVTAGDVTLTASNGLSDQSRRPYIVVTGTPVAARTVTAADVNKLYFVQNQTGQSVTIRGGAQTGVAIAAGAFAYVRLRAGLPAQAVQLVASGGAASVSTLSVTGAATFSSSLTVDGATTLNGNMVFGNAGSDTVTFASSNITWSGNPTHSGNHTFSGNVGVVGAATFIGNVTIGDAPADTLNINPSAVGWPNNPTHSGNHTFSGNVTIQGNTVIGNAGSDTLTIASNAVTWSGNPTHSGTHTFSGLVNASLGVRAQSGAVAPFTPNAGYAFSGDTDSGMFSPADGVLQFGVNGVEVGRLTSIGLTVNGGLTVQGAATLNGNMVFGDAGSDTVTFASSNITWSGNPTHSGNHTFSGAVTHQERLSVTSSVNLSPLVVLTNTGSNGAQIQLTGNGANPHKSIRALNGNFEVINSAYTAAILSLTDAGVLSVPFFSGNGSGITNLNASNLASGTVPDARLTGSYTGFTNLTGSGTVNFATFLGSGTLSATAPYFSFTGDTDTGVGRSAVDTVALIAGGTTRLIANSGGVGITGALAVSGNATANSRRLIETPTTNAVGTTDFPVGTFLSAQALSPFPERGSAVTVRLNPDNSLDYLLHGTGTVLAGNWVCRGMIEVTGTSRAALVQRIS